jgi:ATPase subunit of ABC transporter with duplicated ATPase domains
MGFWLGPNSNVRLIAHATLAHVQIVVMLGENGMGKTTFIRLLAGLLKPDTEEEVPKLNVSYKPQKISPKFEGTVRQLFHTKVTNVTAVETPAQHPARCTSPIAPPLTRARSLRRSAMRTSCRNSSRTSSSPSASTASWTRWYGAAL